MAEEQQPPNVTVPLPILEWLYQGFKQSGGSPYAIRDWIVIEATEQAIAAANHAPNAPSNTGNGSNTNKHNTRRCTSAALVSFIADSRTSIVTWAG